MKSRASRWLLGLVVLHSLNLLVWLRLDHTGAPQVDSATHLRNALLFYQALTPPRPEGLLACLTLWKHYPYPPLCYLLSVPAQWLGGVGPDACALVNLLFFNLMLVGVYRLGSRLWNERVGLAAVCLIGACPMVLFHLQQFAVDAGLLCLVVWLLVAVVEAEGGAHPRWVLAAGVIAGLGMLAKSAYLVYALTPLTLLAAGCWRQGGDARAALVRAACLGLLLCVPWYAANAETVLPLTLWSATQDVSYPPAPLSLWWWTFYAAHLCTENLLPILFVLSLLGFVTEFRSARPSGRQVLLIYTLGTYAILTLIYNKTYRFTPPLAVPAALYAASWLDQRRRRTMAWVAVGLVVLVQVGVTCWGGETAFGERLRLGARGPIMLRINPYVHEPWDAASEQFAQEALQAAQSLGRPAGIVLARVWNRRLSPMGLAYRLERAAAIASRGQWPLEPWFVPCYDARWEEHVPPEVFDDNALAELHDVPELQPVIARLDAQPEWSRRATVPLPDGTRLLLFAKDGAE